VPLIKVLNSMDYWSQQSVGDFLTNLLGDMEVNSNTALASAAEINFAWDPKDQNLPGLNPGTPDQWPDFDSNRQFYFTYVMDRYPSSGPTPGAFRTFFVTHRQGNPDGVCPGPNDAYIVGVSTVQSANQVDTNEELNRMTFFYLQDLVLIGSACINQGQSIEPATTASALLTHELGHQRAGLTHSAGMNAMPQFHQGTYGSVPLHKFDVMTSGVSLVALSSNGTPAFDMLDSYPHDGDMTTCQGILGKWKSITN